MFKTMTDNDRSYHAGASESAQIIEDEDFPVVIVVDQSRVEVYWTDNDLDPHNYYFINYLAFNIAQMVATSVKLWLWRGDTAETIQSRLAIILPSFGFAKI